jgi:mono/diheme cytochrome c family protein
MERKVPPYPAAWFLAGALLAAPACALAAEPAGAPDGPAGEHLDTLMQSTVPAAGARPDAPDVTEPRVPAADLAAARRLKNPAAGDPEALAKGRLLFAANCRVCHGPPDTGPDPDTGLSPPPRDFSSAAFRNARTDGELFYVIKNGVQGTSMLPWASRLAEREIWFLVTYIRAASAPPAP